MKSRYFVLCLSLVLLNFACASKKNNKPELTPSSKDPSWGEPIATRIKDNKPFLIMHFLGKTCLTEKADKSTEGTSCTGLNQTFTFKERAKNRYSVISKTSGNCLEAKTADNGEMSLALAKCDENNILQTVDFWQGGEILVHVRFGELTCLTFVPDTDKKQANTTLSKCEKGLNGQVLFITEPK